MARNRNMDPALGYLSAVGIGAATFVVLGLLLEAALSSERLTSSTDFDWYLIPVALALMATVACYASLLALLPFIVIYKLARRLGLGNQWYFCLAGCAVGVLLGGKFLPGQMHIQSSLGASLVAGTMAGWSYWRLLSMANKPALVTLGRHCPFRFRLPFPRSRNSRPTLTIGTPSYSTISAVA
jgi:hypothetical protein